MWCSVVVPFFSSPPPPPVLFLPPVSPPPRSHISPVPPPPRPPPPRPSYPHHKFPPPPFGSLPLSPPSCGLGSHRRRPLRPCRSRGTPGREVHSLTTGDALDDEGGALVTASASALKPPGPLDLLHQRRAGLSASTPTGRSTPRRTSSRILEPSSSQAPGIGRSRSSHPGRSRARATPSRRRARRCRRGCWRRCSSSPRSCPRPASTARASRGRRPSRPTVPPISQSCGLAAVLRDRVEQRQGPPPGARASSTRTSRARARRAGLEPAQLDDFYAALDEAQIAVVHADFRRPEPEVEPGA